MEKVASEIDGYPIFWRFLDEVIKGRRGKVGLALLYLALSTPFIFNILAILVVVMWVWPVAGGVLEKLAVLGFLFVVLQAVAVQVSRGASIGALGAFIGWLYDPNRKKGKGPPGVGGQAGTAALGEGKAPP